MLSLLKEQNSLSLFGMSKLSSSECGNMEEVWELLTGSKSLY